MKQRNYDIDDDGNATFDGTLNITGATITQPNPDPWIAFHVDEGATEMLRIQKDGFYVRGELVPQDENEAQIVFDTFTEWMNKSLQEADNSEK